MLWIVRKFSTKEPPTREIISFKPGTPKPKLSCPLLCVCVYASAAQHPPRSTVARGVWCRPWCTPSALRHRSTCAGPWGGPWSTDGGKDTCTVRDQLQGLQSEGMHEISDLPALSSTLSAENRSLKPQPNTLGYLQVTDFRYSTLMSVFYRPRIPIGGGVRLIDRHTCLCILSEGSSAGSQR